MTPPAATIAVAPDYEKMEVRVTLTPDDENGEPAGQPATLFFTPAQAAQIGLWLRDCAECVRYAAQKQGERNAGEEKTEPLMRGSSKPRRPDRSDAPGLTLSMGRQGEVETKNSDAGKIGY